MKETGEAKWELSYSFRGAPGAAVAVAMGWEAWLMVTETLHWKTRQYPGTLAV